MSATKWEERYRRGELFDRPPSSWLLHALTLSAGPGTALDIACGPGRHALHLARSGWRVTALDAAPSAIDHLRREAGRQGLTVDARVADLELRPDTIQSTAFDLVADFFYLQRDLFPVMRAALRPGGLLVAEIPLVDERPDVPAMNPRFLLHEEELPRLLAPLDIVAYDEFVPESTANSHARKVARAIARKLGE